VLNILLAGAILGTLAAAARAHAQRRQEAHAATARLAQGHVLARQLAGRRVALERALCALGDGQSEALCGALPEALALLGRLRSFSAAEVADPRLPALRRHKRRRIAPAARALYGMAGTGAGVLGWLAGEPAPARLLGVSLGPGARALLDGTAAPCTEDDLAALRRLSGVLGRLSERCGAAQQALTRRRRRLAELSLDLRIVLNQNTDYRSLSVYPLPGQLHGPRSVVQRLVRAAQALVAQADAPLVAPEVAGWRRLPAAALAEVPAGLVLSPVR